MTARDDVETAPTAADGAPGDQPDGVVDVDDNAAAQEEVSADGSTGADGDDDDGDGDDVVAAAEAAVVDDIARVASERDDYLESLRRLQADFENYRKRVLNQQAEHVERAAQDLVVKLLPVLDTGELAKAHGGGEAVDQVVGMLYELLAKEGLEAIDAAPGTSFDPTMHEAVAHEAGDDGDAQVSEQLRVGYRWKGRLVRPAMVKVKG